MKPARAFLTARWEDLVLLNWAAPETLLEPLLPRGTELDRWQGEALISLVGFRFRDTRVLGVSIPGHRNFPEVNLRFYVRRDVDGTARRAVVFVREIVPRRAIAAIARWIYNEPYLAAPMRERVALDAGRGGEAEFAWWHGGHAFTLRAAVDGPAAPLCPGSEAEFVTEHYYGYTRQRDGGTLEYAVEHPRWRVWSAYQHSFYGPARSLYGDGLGAMLAAPPRSAYVAVGSPVTVRVGRRLPQPEPPRQ